MHGRIARHPRSSGPCVAGCPSASCLSPFPCQRRGVAGNSHPGGISVLCSDRYRAPSGPAGANRAPGTCKSPPPVHGTPAINACEPPPSLRSGFPRRSCRPRPSVPADRIRQPRRTGCGHGSGRLRASGPLPEGHDRVPVCNDAAHPIPRHRACRSRVVRCRSTNPGTWRGVFSAWRMTVA